MTLRVTVQIRPADVPAPAPAGRFWRVKHDVETPKKIWRPGLPEVFVLGPGEHPVRMPEPLQWLWRNLNPGMSLLKMSKVLGGDKLAFTNTGTGFPGHANYLLGEELDKSDPYMDKARICGGAIVREVDRDALSIYIDFIDTRRPLPAPEYVLARPWLRFDAVTSNKDRNKIPFIGRFPQGGGLRVYVPLVAARDRVSLPRDLLVPIAEGDPGWDDPYWIPPEFMVKQD